MGLGIYCRASWKVSEDLSVLKEIGTEFAGASGLRDFFWANNGSNWIEFRLHPAAEPVELIANDATLTLSAKTSSAGPGYHCLVVRFMDVLALRLGLAWEPEDDGEIDETGFFQHRNFDRLQEEMQTFLRTLCRSVGESENLSGWMLNMPLDLDPDRTDVATPMGEWPIAALQEAAEDDNALSRFSRVFFPWWDKELSPAALRNCAVATMWQDIRWHPPQNDHEKRELQAVLDTLKQVRAMDAILSIPTEEFLELETLLAGKEIDLPKPGIGYRRRICRQKLTGDWSLRIEGYFYEKNDEGTLCFWFGDRAAWFSSYSFEPAREATMADVTNDKEKADHLVEHHGIVGRAVTNWKEKDGGYFSMSCAFQSFGTSAVLTLIFPSDSYRDWAETVFRSVRCEGRQPQVSSKAN